MQLVSLINSFLSILLSLNFNSSPIYFILPLGHFYLNSVLFVNCQFVKTRFNSFNTWFLFCQLSFNYLRCHLLDELNFSLLRPWSTSFIIFLNIGSLYATTRILRWSSLRWCLPPSLRYWVHSLLLLPHCTNMSVFIWFGDGSWQLDIRLVAAFNILISISEVHTLHWFVLDLQWFGSTFISDSNRRFSCITWRSLNTLGFRWAASMFAGPVSTFIFNLLLCFIHDLFYFYFPFLT